MTLVAAPEKSPLVYVLIVNYNGRHWLEACLRSLYAAAYERCEVVLIDNASADGSVEFVKAEFPQTTLIVNDDNLGFCEGNNVGIRAALAAGADYIVLLNNDTIVTPDWLTEMVRVGESEPQVGILGAVQLSYDGTDFNSWTKEEASAYLPELQTPATARAWIPMRWVEGSCFMIKRSVVEEVGLLDPIYFMYYEEIDWCRRVHAHGYRVALVPRCRIRHYRGGTSKASAEAKRARALLYDRSQLIYHATNPQRRFGLNLIRYLLTFGFQCFVQLRRGRFRRIRDLIGLQPQLVRAFPSIRRKWKTDRRRMKMKWQKEKLV